jgi:C-terminal peptidase prc
MKRTLTLAREVVLVFLGFLVGVIWEPIILRKSPIEETLNLINDYSVFLEGERQRINFNARVQKALVETAMQMLQELDPHAETASSITNLEGKKQSPSYAVNLLETPTREVVYLKINYFGIDLENGGVKKIEEKLKSYIKRYWVESIIIDLRNNPGGRVDAALKVLDLFLPAGKEVHLKKRGRKFKIRWKTSKREVFNESVFVLVNRNTASAAEIFADLIQRNQRGLVIGEITFGKNSVQNLVCLDALETLCVKYTSAISQYATGETRIIPDIIINEEKEDILEKALTLSQSF